MGVGVDGEQTPGGGEFQQVLGWVSALGTAVDLHSGAGLCAGGEHGLRVEAGLRAGRGR
jgi:hypothetical protein